MEEELERKIFYRKDYPDVKKMEADAEKFAKKMRLQYADCLVTKEYVNAVNILVRVTTVRMLYKSDRYIERQRVRERDRSSSRGRGRSRDMERGRSGGGRSRTR